MSTRSQLTKDLNESVKSLLGRHTKILVKYMIKLETKNDKTENRVLVFTPVRIYLLIAKVPTKIDCNFHYLDIQSIDSKNSTHFSIITNERVFSFVTTGDAGNFSSNADVILTDLASAIKQLFPTVPLKHIIRKIDAQPIEREQIFSDEIRPSDPKNIGPCGGFSMQYASMCDYHNVPYREEVAWDIDTIYLSHDNRILNLKDFDHLDSKDLMAIVSALEYNTFFRGLKITNSRLSSETLERILHILRRSMWLEELHLESLGLKSDFLHKLAVAVISNNNPAIKSIDLSHNVIEDKGATSICALAGKLVQGAIHLAGPIAKVSKGLCKLYLSHCGLTSKGVNQIAHSLFLNQSISNTLTHLDLSGNCLKDDINNLYNFLAQPNVLEHLNLSGTDITLENLFGALLRGCGTHLSYLNVSHNSFSTKKGKEIPPSYKQFFTSSLSLKHLNIACCKLPLEALKNLLLGLACNESTANLYLDLSGNSLGLHGAHVLESCIHGVRVVHSLDISDNNLDAEMASVVTAIGRNPSIRCLYMTKCFLGMKTKNISTVMDSLVNFIQKDDCLLTKLVLSDNKLKTDLHNFVNALGSNQSLQELDISSNYMGDIGARLLAKALQINTKLKWISLDRNNVTLQGFSDIVYALENNYSMKNIPFPLFDTAPCLKSQPEKTDLLMRKMQEYLQRNCNGYKRINGHGFRLQHGFLLSSTHQLVDKIVAECQETMSIQQNSLDINIQRLLDDAENCKQLLPKLQESLRCDPHPIETKLDKIVSEINDSIKLYLEEILNSMLQTGIDHCPKTLGNQMVINDLRKQCMERLVFPEEFIQSCMFNSAGTEIMNKISEIEQSIASMIADRATDEVLEALTRYQKGLSISDSSYMISDNLTPDVIRRSSQDTNIFASVDRCDLNLPNLGLDSPTATPHLPTKRRSVARKLRPQSVVGLGIENLSLSHIPDLLDPNSHSNSQLNDKDDDGNDGDSITELPSASFQLQHLVKGRPKRAKTRAPTKPLMPELQTQTLGEGLETFFGPGSATPSTLTPLVSPTSEECSSLSFVDSPTMSRDDTRYNLTSEETTPILEERKIIRGDRVSPVMKSTWNSRSLSSDNLEKYSPLADRKSPLIKLKTENDSSLAEELYDQPLSLQHHHMPHYSSNHHKSSHHYYTSSHHTNDDDENNSIMTTSMGGASGKNRPWSVAGSNESKSLDFLGSDGTGRQDSLDNSDVLPIKSSGGSIVGISPGAAMSGNNNSCGGGSIVGITPGAAMEKKSVRDLAAGLNRLGEQSNKPLTRPQVQPRVSRNSHDYQNVSIENSSIDNKPPEVVKRIVAGKKITAQFELFGALLRGCGTHLSYLNVSHNSFSTKKGKEIPPSYKQFFTSSLSLKHLNIACCKLPLEALKNLLLGLACNESTANLYLDLSGNSLGLHGAHVLESCIHGVRVVHSLDISDNNLDAEMASVVTAIGRNPSIRCLYMTKCFLGMKTKNISTVMDSLVNFIQKDDCLLTKLVLSDNKLKTDLHNFVNALGSNQSLQELDISSNYMGDIGARLLAKALQINTKLKWISLDRNNVTLQGFSDIVYALENNYSMKNIPFPLFDTAPCLKSQPEKTDLLMRKMQEYLQRNCNGYKRINGHGFRLQHGFLLSSTHQLVDKIVAECQETMSIQQNSLDINIQRLLDDAENCKQLLPKLQESLRCDPHPIETKLDKIVSEINDSIKLYLEEILNSMLQTGIDHCPKTLGNQMVINDLRKQCMERLVFPEEFIQSCMFNSAGTEIMNKISEIEQSIASMIADRATDEVLEALTRYQKGLSISDSSYMISDNLTPDVIRRSSQDTNIFASVDRCDLNLPNLGLDSPTATPHLPTKRRSVARKLRPQSVVGLGIENLSLSHIPDLLDPNSHSNSQLNDKDDDGNDGDSITELPSASFQLQHLVKGRPKRAKTRAPTKPLMPELQTQTLGEGLETFFGPDSATPSTLTPLVSPTSEECSSLSFVDSPTMSRDDTRYNLTSEETTPILEERKIIRGDRVSPVMKSTWNSRSLSSDNLEKYSPLADRKSPLIKLKTENDSSLAEELYDQPLSLQHHHMPHYSSNHHKSSHHYYTSSHHTNDDDENNSIMTTSMGGASGKNRPWSVAGSNESKSLDFLGSDGTGRQDSLDNSDVLPIKSSGGSIVGISPGAAMSGNNNSCGGGSIVGITPGAAMEKKSVRDLAAGLNRLGEQSNKPLTRPQVQPRVSRNSHDYQNVSIENSSIDNKPPEVVKRIVAGKKITAQFEETLVEGLQRKSFRHTIFKENQYSKDDSVDV